jgi:hypothetical protein
MPFSREKIAEAAERALKHRCKHLSDEVQNAASLLDDAADFIRANSNADRGENVATHWPLARNESLIKNALAALERRPRRNGPKP